MKTVIINLKKDTRKRQWMERQLRELSISAEFVEGVYGRDLPVAEYSAALSRFRWWCAVGRPAAPAEVGCALSHFSVYRSMSEPTCILEDDVRISSEFSLVLSQVEQTLEANKPQVFLLSNHDSLVPIGEAGTIRRDNSGMCTDGYVITPPAAQCLLKWNLPMRVPCDTWRRWAGIKEFELYHVFPSVISQAQDELGSSTSENRLAVQDFPLLQWLTHKSKRAIGCMLDRMLCAMGVL